MSDSFAAGHSSESNEWYTPTSIIERARTLMLSIDLDPASCEKANEEVKAKVFYDEASNGFTKGWHGNVFLNPPGGYCDALGRSMKRAPRQKLRSAQKAWWEALSHKWLAGEIDQAVFVGFNAEILRTTQSCVLPCLTFPCCIPQERLSFMQLRDGKFVRGASPTHMNVIVWLPPSSPRVHDGATRYPADRKHMGSWMPPFAHAFRDIGYCF